MAWKTPQSIESIHDLSHWNAYFWVTLGWLHPIPAVPSSISVPSSWICSWSPVLIYRYIYIHIYIYIYIYIHIYIYILHHNYHICIYTYVYYIIDMYIYIYNMICNFLYTYYACVYHVDIIYIIIVNKISVNIESLPFY